MNQAVSQNNQTSAVDGLDYWINTVGSSKKQMTLTVYDQPLNFTGTPPVQQENLRNRVSYTFTKDNAVSTAAYNAATFYTYDIHGNVDRLHQQYAAQARERTPASISD